MTICISEATVRDRERSSLNAGSRVHTVAWIDTFDASRFRQLIRAFIVDNPRRLTSKIYPEYARSVVGRSARVMASISDNHR